MRKYFVTASCACLLYLSLSPAFALTNEANFIREYRAKAVQAQFNNRYEEAIGHYQQAVELATQTYGANSPFVGEIYYDMGSLALTNSQFKNAEEWLEQSVKLNPNSSGGRLRLAELEALKGRTDEAVRQAALVVAKHKDDPVAHQQLAIALDKNGDGLKSLREFAVSEQLTRIERMRADGRAPSKPLISIPPIWQAPKTEPSQPAVPKDDAKAEAEKKKAAAEAKKAADEAKRVKAEMAKIEAAQKDAAKKADASRKAELKKQQDAKRAADAAKIAKAKAAQAAAKKAAQVASDAKPMTGMKANLTSKAVLLTPVGKKPAAAQSTSTEVVKPAVKPLTKAEPKFDETVETPDEEVVKPVPKKVVKPAEPAKPAAIKPVKPMKGGLVPPPPPVIPTMQMIAPPPAVPVAKPKAAAPKKEEKPKVETPKEEKPATHHDPGAGGADDDDFLLDWGGAKGKKK